jgi:FkbM family methyltransferase
MAACVAAPPWLDLLKPLWLGFCIVLLGLRPMRSYAPEIVTDEGLKLVGRVGDSVLNRIIFYRGCFEPVLTREVKARVQPGDCCLDAGANVGYFTLLMAQCAGPAGRVIAVEAAPGNARRLRRNIAANRGGGEVRVVEAVCADLAGRMRFHVHARNDMHSRLQPPGRFELDRWLMGRKSWRPVEVEALTLPQILGADAARVAFVKLDIEGAERLVCRQLLEVCTHPQLVVALEAKAPHIRETLEPFEKEGFLAIDLQNDYRWLLNRRQPQSKPVSFEELYRRRFMVDVLLLRQ